MGALLSLGVESFDRQHQALATLTAEKFEAAFEARTLEAAAAVFPAVGGNVLR